MNEYNLEKIIDEIETKQLEFVVENKEREINSLYERKNKMTALVLVIVAALAALAFAAFNFTTVKKMDEGTDKMSEIAAAIRVGANAFIVYEYKIIAIVVAILAVLFIFTCF